MEAIHKAKPWKSEKYLSFVRSRPCVVSGREGEEIVAHHVRCLGGGGMGLKPPDWLCVPITAANHSLLHSMGERTYWERHGINPIDCITMTMLVYLAQRPSIELISDLSELLKK